MVAAAAALLASCAQHGSMMPASPSAIAPLEPDLTPPECKGQKDAKKYSSLTETLSTKGGTLCIPEFGGFGGTVKYPGANPSIQLTLTSSTTNYDGLPKLGKGAAIFYLQLATSGKTSFGTKGTAGGGLTGAKIVPGKAYTAFGQATVFSVPFNFGPCYAIATKGKYGGVIGGLGTILKGQSIPFAATGVIEIYSGKQTSTEC
jgi:hypothetical protein